MSKFPKPLGQRVIIEPIPVKEEKTYVFVPDESKERPSIGIVKAVGIGMYATETGALIPMEVMVGNKVSYGQFAGATIKVENDDTEYILLKQDDISLIL